MSDPENSEERGFTVVDRRAGASSESAPEPEVASAPEPPAVDFASFCLSLGTSALYHLGVVAHPESRESIPQLDLPAARQTIDLLEMLESKTQGNLDAEEAKLLEGLLYELRMRFVEVSREAGAGSDG